MIKPLIQEFLAVFLYYSGLIRLLRFFGRNQAKIVLYHSVSDVESDFVKGTQIWVSGRSFEKHLSYIRKNYRIISLERLVEALNCGDLPSRALVVTFDDGFADNFVNARASLKQHRIPATVFLTTNAIDNRQPIWVQQLCYLVNTVGLGPTVESLAALECPLPPIDRAQDKGLRDLERYLRYSVPAAPREQLLSTLFRRFGIDRDRVFSEHGVFVTERQIKQMSDEGLSFGNHGTSHSVFAVMSTEEQREEIVDAKRVLDDLLGQDFLPFSYPFGCEEDFTAETRAIVKELGHACSLRADPLVNRKGTSPFELGRINVENIPVHRLAFELEKGVLRSIVPRGRN